MKAGRLEEISQLEYKKEIEQIEISPIRQINHVQICQNIFPLFLHIN